jgi:glucose-6-phosphate 1-dehydrogenase
MANARSDALVFFGATGDLAYKKIFPALQAMVKRGNLNVPVVGVAKAGWNLDQLPARAKDSLEKHGGVDAAAFEKLSSLLRYVDGDYQAPSRSKPFARTQGRTVSRSLPGHSPCSVRNRRGTASEIELCPGCAGYRREAIRAQSCVGARA